MEEGGYVRRGGSRRAAEIPLPGSPPFSFLTLFSFGGGRGKKERKMRAVICQDKRGGNGGLLRSSEAQSWEDNSPPQGG